VKLQDAGILQKDEIESLCEIEASKPILAFINNIVTAPIAAAVVSAESEVVKEEKYDEIEKTAAPAPREFPAKKPVKSKSNKNKKGKNKENSRKPAASQSKKMENPKSVDIPSCQASCSKVLTPPPQQKELAKPPSQELITPSKQILANIENIVAAPITTVGISAISEVVQEPQADEVEMSLCKQDLTPPTQEKIITSPPQEEIITAPPQEEITPLPAERTPSDDKGDLMKKIEFNLKKHKPLEQIYEMINVSNFAAI
jgi:signal recognition particle GTPase